MLVAWATFPSQFTVDVLAIRTHLRLVIVSRVPAVRLLDGFVASTSRENSLQCVSRASLLKTVCVCARRRCMCTCIEACVVLISLRLYLGGCRYAYEEFRCKTSYNISIYL